jgi:hypothetical protein
MSQVYIDHPMVIPPHPHEMRSPHVFQSAPVTTCAFPPPPVRMVYCQPAAYQRTCGQRYQTIMNAYGKARPLHM